jgi:ATP-dependent exoDNAse (exonuclease V) beta subunit
MIKILRASAGSGKTYNLAKEYIRLLMASDRADAYRHVLAVTFTNKATDEMKRRILKELHILATDPSRSPYLEALVPAVLPNLTAVQNKAQQQLSGILHDYSAFAVSTIDKFFQQTLRAFSREIGQFTTYQVQLDREALVTESVDRVLDGLSEEGDRTLLNWLTGGVQQDLQQRGVFHLEGRLTEMAKSLRDLPEGKDIPRETLDSLRSCCRQVRKDFENRLSAASKACLDALSGAGIAPEDTNGGFLKTLRKYTGVKGEVSPLTPAFVKKAQDPDLWFSKAKSQLKAGLGNALDRPLQEFLDCFGLPLKEYNTAGTILDQLYSLGVAAELRESITAIQKEKNLLSLDDSNTILKGIIDGTDAPFIYEKLGVRYDDFLLDEFQDTADVQWENFRPLLHNSVASGNDSLVVGDVKQSIYRWRGSDWSLLKDRLQEEFRQAQVDVLGGNYRTCRAIVAFNNDFFAYAAQALDSLLGTDIIGPIYADVRQEARFRDKAEGSVEVLFAEDQMQEILNTLAEIRDRGGRWSDVAILVRSNGEGADIAGELLRNGIPVVSDDSLFVKTSVTVRRLVSQLSLVEAPPQEEAPTVAGYLARSMQVRIPDGYHSLTDLAESLLRDIREAAPETFDAEIPYIQSFMDYLQDWVATGGNNLDGFLKAWKDAEPKIASPQRGNSVRVMTIHKSKGLEFPFVIVPFAEKVSLYKGSPYWCAPALEGTALENKAEGVYRVNLDGGAADTLFEEDYRRERVLQAIDNLNVFYVALTRPQYGLKIIAAPMPKGFSEPKNMAHLLYTYLGTESFTAGQPYPLGTLPREEAGPESLEAGYASFPADSGNRLKFSPEAADYFGADGSIGLEASRRIRGTVLHGILSRVATEEDLAAAVDAAVGSGELPADTRSLTLDLLRERIASVAERNWFAPGVRVLSEASVIGPDGREYRPDRVVLHPGGEVDIIDYKFGQPEERYTRQVQRYMNLYRRMGHAKVAGYLWYLEDNLITFVD